MWRWGPNSLAPGRSSIYEATSTGRYADTLPLYFQSTSIWFLHSICKQEPSHVDSDLYGYQFEPTCDRSACPGFLPEFSRVPILRRKWPFPGNQSRWVSIAGSRERWQRAQEWLKFSQSLRIITVIHSWNWPVWTGIRRFREQQRFALPYLG